jgi:hypothetical protein
MVWTTPRTWSTGEIVTAAQLNTHLRDDLNYLYDNRVVKIAESVLGASAASVTLSSIPGTYRNLFILWQARGDTAAVNTQMQLQFNGDTGANYDYIEENFRNGTASGAGAVAATAMSLDYLAASTAPVGTTGGGRIMIPNYAGTTFHKTVITEAFMRDGTVATSPFLSISGGDWRSTVAITSVLLKPTAGNFIAGSSFQLYGEA